MLSLNMSKTNYILFHSKGKRGIIPSKLLALFISDVKIKKVEKRKFFGIMIDESLMNKSKLL